jgi:outer membrane protein OmpA-like peptidoglycan-associated protein
VVAAALCLGCRDTGILERDITEADTRIRQVLAAGAYDCAPRELALARAHLEFARVDYAQGDPGGASDHVREASLNARAAARLSPSDRCAGEGSQRAPTLGLPTGPDADLDGVGDATDQCPDQHEDADGYLDGDGCPDPDNDQDGIPDAVDACPDAREDKPGTAGADGCPDADQDADGVADNLDRCPDQAGAVVDQGCPRLRYENLEVTSHALRLTQPVLFDTGTPAIRSVSLAVLDTVVQVLREHREITLQVEAHTDSQGDNERNLELSKAQAEAVRSYLIDHGIEASRLTSQGYGETRPIESNRTSQGRDINRRVEFVRTDTAP